MALIAFPRNRDIQTHVLRKTPSVGKTPNLFNDQFFEDSIETLVPHARQRPIKNGNRKSFNNLAKCKEKEWG